MAQYNPLHVLSTEPFLEPFLLSLDRNLMVSSGKAGQTLGQTCVNAFVAYMTYKYSELKH